MFGRHINSSFPFIDNHARTSTFHVAHVALQGIVNGSGGGAPGLTVVGGQPSRLFDGAAGNFAAGGFDDDVSAWDAASMEPDIVGCRLVEGDFFVLAAVLADKYRKAVAALHV